MAKGHEDLSERMTAVRVMQVNGWLLSPGGECWRWRWRCYWSLAADEVGRVSDLTLCEYFPPRVNSRESSRLEG